MANAPESRRLVYRQRLWTRITHWVWAIALFFLLLSGLQIFNAHPTLYVGKQSGFNFNNEVLALGADETTDGKPVATVAGHVDPMGPPWWLAPQPSRSLGTAARPLTDDQPILRAR